MRTYQIGDLVDIDWMGFDGPTIVQGTVLDILDDEVEVQIRRENELMELTIEPYRIHKARQFSIMGDK